MGPIEVTTEREKTFSLPPAASAATLVVGLGLVGIGLRRRSQSNRPRSVGPRPGGRVVLGVVVAAGAGCRSTAPLRPGLAPVSARARSHSVVPAPAEVGLRPGPWFVLSGGTEMDTVAFLW